MMQKSLFQRSDRNVERRKTVFFLFLIAFLPSVPYLTGWSVLTLLLNAGTALTAWYCFCGIFDNEIGLLCSALYTLSIYRIYLLEYEGALGESAALLFLPLILYGWYRLLTEEPTERSYRTIWMLMAIGYAGVLQSHLVSFEITMLFTGLITLANLRKVFRGGTLLELGKGVLGIVILSAWYLLLVYRTVAAANNFSAWLYMDSIQKRGLTPIHLLVQFWTNGSTYPESGQALQDSSALGVGFLLMACGGLLAILWFNGKLSGRHNPKDRFLKIILVISVCFLAMTQSYFPWDHIMCIRGFSRILVGAIRTPVRFLGWATLCLAAAAGGCLQCLRGKEKYFRLLAVLLSVGIVTSGLYLSEQRNDREVYAWNYDQGIGLNPVSGAEYLYQKMEGGYAEENF